MTIIIGTAGRAFANKNCQQGQAFDQFFQMPGVCPGEGCSRLELTCTLFFFFFKKTNEIKIDSFSKKKVMKLNLKELIREDGELVWNICCLRHCV